VGFATGSKNKGKDGPSDSEFLFGEAFVHPDHRRKGIADATETFLSRIVVSSGSSTAYTIVEEENTGSQARMNRSGRGGGLKKPWFPKNDYSTGFQKSLGIQAPEPKGTGEVIV
jgi:hypothetical protein